MRYPRAIPASPADVDAAGEWAVDAAMAEEFTETPEGYAAREKWAERYDELNGAPESDEDR